MPFFGDSDAEGNREKSMWAIVLFLRLSTVRKACLPEVLAESPVFPQCVHAESSAIRNQVVDASRPPRVVKATCDVSG